MREPREYINEADERESASRSERRVIGFLVPQPRPGSTEEVQTFGGRALGDIRDHLSCVAADFSFFPTSRAKTKKKILFCTLLPRPRFTDKVCAFRPKKLWLNAKSPFAFAACLWGTLWKFAHWIVSLLLPIRASRTDPANCKF